MAKPWVLGVSCFAAGIVLASGAWTAFPPRAAAPSLSKEDAGAPAPESDDDALRKANANLTESLQACDRQLADLRDRGDHAPPAVAPEPVAEQDAGRFGGRRRDRGEPTKEDWERMAQLGVVRVRIPCIRDAPWKPNERTVNRLGLAPDDEKTIEDAYAASNKRVLEQIRPLCAKALGSTEIADKVGATACIDAIQNSERRADPKAAKDALSRAAELQAGKRSAARGDASPLEQLANALASESRAFENDLAQKLGPDEAKRIASDPSLCAERKTLRTSDEPLEPRGDRGGRGRGR